MSNSTGSSQWSRMSTPKQIAFLAFLLLMPVVLIFLPEIQGTIGTLPDRATANSSELLFLVIVKLVSWAGYLLAIVNASIFLRALSPSELSGDAPSGSL